jgi:hypothetical protein
MGLTGNVSLEVDGNKGRIVDLVLGCKVMGRKITVIMLYTVIKYAKLIRLREIWANSPATSSVIGCLVMLIKCY